MFTKDLGDSIIIETTIKKNEPFEDTSTNTDPDTITISIEDSDGNSIISDTSMTKNATGEYYYNWDTSDSLSEGHYKIIIEITLNESKEIDDSFIRLQ